MTTKIEQYVESFRKETGINFQVKSKTESSINKVIDPVMSLINPKFVSDYIQTYTDTMYVSDSFHKLSEESQFEVALHESQHALDWHKLWLLFWGLYLSPQLFVLLFVVFIWFSWQIALLCLLFLLPWPSWGKMWLEVRAYRTYPVYRRLSGNPLTQEQLQFYIERVVSQLSERWYYWAWPFKNNLRSRLMNTDVSEYGYIQKFVDATKTS